MSVKLIPLPLIRLPLIVLQVINDTPETQYYIEAYTTRFSSSQWSSCRVQCTLKLIHRVFRDWSLIRGRGGATKWENRWAKTFCDPPEDRVKLFMPPL